MTTKQVNGGYYKGNRTGSMGFFGPKKGQYIIDYRKVRTYNYPAEHMKEFKVSTSVKICHSPSLPINQSIDKFKLELLLTEEMLYVFIQMTPFVTQQMHPTASKYTKPNPDQQAREEGYLFKYRRMNGRDYLEEWARKNEHEYNFLVHGVPMPGSGPEPSQPIVEQTVSTDTQQTQSQTPPEQRA